ncbi:MAG: DNA-processing protein DprA, partial [Alphaproteobacteria bacterium]
FLEMGAYEALWAERGATFPRLAQRFAGRPTALPSDFVEHGEASRMAEAVRARIRAGDVERFGVRVHRAGEYPARLRDAEHPVELLYFIGDWGLVDTPSVAVVGTRHPTPEGVARTRKLVRGLVDDGRTVVSGLAAGIDTAAHTAAIEAGGKTIAVIGTPLNHVYPRENAELQKRIAREYLVISQVPVQRYEMQDYRQNRLFFPARNVTMSALTAATIIVEAGETSGTLIQARAALKQGRKLFILDSAFRNPRLTWPRRFEAQGAIRVSDYEQIREHLPLPTVMD